MKTLSLFLLCLVPTCLMAQHISPTDLLQINKLWQINDNHTDKTTVDYLRSIDSNWRVRSKPTIDEHGYMLIIAYSRDHKQWFNPLAVKLGLSIERGTLKRGLIYGFTDSQTWDAYLAQMVKMDAQKLGAGPSQGGQQTIFQINDIAFILTEFPPGVNGEEKAYQVSILQGR